MDWLSNLLTDDRLTANVIAGHAFVTVTFVLALFLRQFLFRAGTGLSLPLVGDWFNDQGKQAILRIRSLVIWVTLLLHFMIALGIATYHLAGRDIRREASAFAGALSLEKIWEWGSRALLVAVVLGLAWLCTRFVRRLLPAAPEAGTDTAQTQNGEKALSRGLRVVQSYGILSIRLTALWWIGKILGLAEITRLVVGFLFRVMTVLILARFLALGVRIGSRWLKSWGDTHLAQPPFSLYWKRFTRLMPTGEYCFQIAIYIVAVSGCIDEFLHMHRITRDTDLSKEYASLTRLLLRILLEIQDFGPRLACCIAIFFATRVLIEWQQVLFGQAFGLYRRDRPVDQKARTLVPLLCSLGQYVIYFGAAVAVLRTLEIDIMPLLAAVSILGLAIGLGAQSLVQDVVSGFFILFEGQYLVGDAVQVGDAQGMVEAVSIRVTHIRDYKGRLFIIPNGQIKTVVSLSKDYVNAVVDLQVSTSADLENIFWAMTEAGQRLRRANTEVLEATVISGVVDMGAEKMTVRAITRVEPGSHGRMENEYRRVLKQVLADGKTSTTPRAA